MAHLTGIQRNAWFPRGAALAALLVGIISAQPAQALPLFARQTGMACMACHTNYPELTHFGRMFKLQGYQLDDGKDIEVTSDEGKPLVSLPAIPNLALFIMSGWVQLGKALPDSNIPGAQSLKSGIQYPQQISLLYGGKIAPHFGAFAQITYDSSAGTFGIDNTDFRFADTFVLPNKTKLTYGVSINNNPSVEDPWNTTPAFGFPYVPPEINVPQLTGPQINAALAGQVAGPVFYALWNEQLYGAVGFYKAAKVGSVNPITAKTAPYDSATGNVLDGLNPYWRAAYEYDFDRYAFEVGAYGARFKIFPGGGIPLTGLTNNYTDVAGDFQLQFIGEQHISTWKGTYVREHQSLDASYALGASNATNWVSYLSTDVDYWYKRKYGVTLGYLSTKGSTDPLAYPSSPTYCAANACGGSINPTTTPGAFPVGVTNSANSNPTTNAWVTELNYQAWLNVKFVLQYTHYTKFNGATSNYDGVGR
ncbi:MAG: hypothetical protein ACHP9S_11275, partial [Terriglobales bacterium]